MNRIVALLFVALLAGCLGATTPKEPTGEQNEWEGEPEIWMVLSSGSGFAGPSPHPLQQALVMYTSGEVMHFRYGVEPTPEGNPPINKVYLENFTEAIGQVRDFATLFAEEGNNLNVTNITTAHLGDDKAKIHRVLETAHTFARDPGEPELEGCADCAPDYFTSEKFDVQLWGSYEGTAWQDILDQLRLVQAWIHEFHE